MFHSNFRTIVSSLMVALIGITPMVSANASQWPDKALTIITPYAAGGATDQTARIFAKKLSEDLGKPVNVKNIPGGQTVTAINAALKEDPNYTFIVTDSGFVQGPSSLGNDDYKKFKPVQIFATVPFLVTRHKDVPADDFMKSAKAKKPVQIAVATLVIPSSTWTTTLEGLKVERIPHTSGKDAMVTCAGGHVPYCSMSVTGSMTWIESGSLAPVMISSEKRSSKFPNVPTYKELGFKGTFQSQWYGLVVNKDIDPKVAEILYKWTNKQMTTDSEVKTFLVDRGMDIAPKSMADSNKEYLNTATSSAK